MKELKKLGVLSVGKISALFGLLVGIFAAVYLAILAYLPSTVQAMMGVTGIQFTLLLGLYMVLMQFILYFVIGVLCAVLYNLFAKWVGGVAFDLDEKVVKKKVAKKK